jgi:20S proteasome alpha/beta subunit
MTTITYKDGVIAYDSLAVSDITIVDNNFDKHIEKDNVHFFFSGCVADITKLIECYFGAKHKINSNSSAIVYDKNDLFIIGFGKNGNYYCDPERLDNCIAIGSGTDHALTAMDLGCSAKKAIKMAAKRDTCTGGKIRKFKINGI